MIFLGCDRLWGIILIMNWHFATDLQFAIKKFESLKVRKFESPILISFFIERVKKKDSGCFDTIPNGQDGVNAK